MANYHIHVDGQSTGPFTEEQLREQHTAGQIKDDTLVWAENTPDWVTFKELNLTKPKIGLRRAEASPPPMPVAGDAGLQFERADFAKPAGQTVTCSGCKSVINDAYYEVNGKIACAKCHDGLKAALGGGSGMIRFLRALGAGIAAAAVGSAIWYAILKAMNMELGLIAIAVGLLVGFAVRWGCNGRGGWLYKSLAMLLTYCAIVTTHIPFILQAFRDVKTKHESAASSNDVSVTATGAVEHANSTDTPSSPKAGKRPRSAARFLIAWTVIFAIAFVSPFLEGLQSVLGIIIIGIALYEAWKINRRVPIAINGPFRVGAPRPAT
jgi:hypothetical protein